MPRLYTSFAIALGLLGCGLTHGSSLGDKQGAIGSDDTAPPALPSWMAGAPADPSPRAGAGAEGDVPAGDPAQGAAPGDVSVNAGSFAHPIDVHLESPPDDRPVQQDPGANQGDDPGPMQPGPVETGACPGVVAALFHVEGAGSGVISGCAQRTCTGFDIAAYEATAPLDRYASNVSDFAGCTEIEGDLVVSMHQGSDLQELSCLERVSGSVVIWQSQGLLSLDGLEALSEVGGAFELSDHGSLSSENYNMVDFDALTHLQAVGGRLSICGDPALVYFGDLPALQVVGGEVFIQFPYGGHEIAGMNALQYVGGGFNLWRPEGLERVTGLQSLETIGGTLLLWGATDLVELNGLPKLSCVGRDLDIGGNESWENNPKLRVVHAFPALRTIAGDLLLEWNPALEQFDLLQSVASIGGKIIVTNNPRLESFPLDALQSAARFEVHDNAMLSECALSQALDHVATNDPTSQIVAPNLPCL